MAVDHRSAAERLVELAQRRRLAGTPSGYASSKAFSTRRTPTSLTRRRRVI